MSSDSGAVHTKPEKFEKATITDHLDFNLVFEQNSDREIA